MLDGHEEGESSSDDEHGAADGRPPHDAVPNRGQDDAADECQARAREESDTHRRLAGEWLASQPFTHIVITRLIMEPLRRLMRGKFVVAGSAWKDSERRKASQADTTQGVAQSFPILEAARGTLETSCEREINTLLTEPAFWGTLIPARDRHVSNRGLSFRMLSSGGCYLLERLTLKHRTSPIRTFLALDSAEQADQILHARRCSWDPWTAAFVEPHLDAPQGLRGEVPQAQLGLVASLADCDISQVEAGHASLRRRLFSRGVQTHKLPFETLSAEWVLDKVRHRGKLWDVPPLEGGVVEETQVDGIEDSAAEKEVHRYGGPWRAYVRERTFGQAGGLPDTAQLSKDYRELPPEEIDRLRAKGNDARASKQAGAPGSSSFGLSSRELKRMQARLSKDAAIARVVAPLDVAATSKGDRAQAVIDGLMALPAGRSVAEVVHHARAIMAHNDAASRAQLEREKQQFQDWRETIGMQQVQALVSQHEATSSSHSRGRALSVLQCCSLCASHWRVCGVG